MEDFYKRASVIFVFASRPKIPSRTVLIKQNLQKGFLLYISTVDNYAFLPSEDS